jgi:hypothetical protein
MSSDKVKAVEAEIKALSAADTLRLAADLIDAGEKNLRLVQRIAYMGYIKLRELELNKEIKSRISGGK